MNAAQIAGAQAAALTKPVPAASAASKPPPDVDIAL